MLASFSNITFTLGFSMNSAEHTSPLSEFVKQQLADGKQTNSLIYEKSPYLLQHAFNPVHWLPWSDEAFGRAESGKTNLFSFLSATQPVTGAMSWPTSLLRMRRWPPS